MNKIKQLLFALPLILAFVGFAKANERGWITVQSTAVCFSTGSNLELLTISWSTGSFTWGTDYFVLVDSNTNPASLGTTLPATTLVPNSFPVSQWATPPIQLFQSSSTINGYNTTEKVTRNFVDFKDKEGDGVSFKNGINLFQVGTLAPRIYTLEYRKKR